MALHPVSRVKLSTQIEKSTQRSDFGRKVEAWVSASLLKMSWQKFSRSAVCRSGRLWQALSAQGLIETRIGDGSFISQPSIGTFMQDVIPDVYLADDSLQAVLEFRRVFEGPVAELAATRATDEQISQLAVLYHQMWEYADDADKNSYYDLSFHMLIGEMTGNPMITGVYRILNNVLRSSWHRVTASKGPKMGFYYHEQLLNAFRQKNPKLCREVMEEHVANSWFLLFGDESQANSAGQNTSKP